MLKFEIILDGRAKFYLTKDRIVNLRLRMIEKGGSFIAMNKLK